MLPPQAASTPPDRSAMAPLASITSRSKPSATPLAGGICGDRGEKILVERIALAVAPLLFVHRRVEAAALLGGVGQFAKAVGEFDAAGIDLEPFGDARIGRLGARQRRLRRRIFEQHGQTPLPQIRLDMLDQHLAENVRPGVVVGDPHLVRRRRRQRGAVALAVRRWSPADRCRQSARTPRPPSAVPARQRDRRSGRETQTARCRWPAPHARSRRRCRP